MRPIEPYATSFAVSVVEDEVVFLSPGPNFSMTQDAARMTFVHLAEALQTLDTVRLAAEIPTKLAVVLLVDDEPLARGLGALLLEDAGYVVIEAGSANQALQTLETGALVDLLFTDIQMPGELDGLQLANLVTDRWPAVGVLISSGQVEPGRDALPPNARFIAKPYAVDVLLRHVGELVAN